MSAMARGCAGSRRSESTPQITRGVRHILSFPFVYSSCQAVMGAHRSRLQLVREFIRPFPGMRVLDIGCGPADILAYLPGVEYWGFDISPAYVERARARFGQAGRFSCRKLTKAEVDTVEPFDVVLMLGVLHHMEDAQAMGLLRLANRALKSAGRLLAVDPCISVDQHPIARFLVKHDRGAHVRTAEQYSLLTHDVFNMPHVQVRHQSWIPYTHCLMECTRT